MLLSVPYLAETLDKADGRAGELEAFTQLIFEEALKTEVQRLVLVGEENERRRRGRGLRDVIDFHLAAGRRCSALEIHFGKPAIEFTGGNSAATGFGDFINEWKKFFGALAGFGGEENDRRIGQKFQLRAHKFFVILREAGGVDRACHAERLTPRGICGDHGAIEFFGNGSLPSAP